ncbi:hypothetical protein T4C_9540 [Trichinella pseudospiralis]|nr:hypothetical protein T4C_9540 [Trichinella pseudospiralis]
MYCTMWKCKSPTWPAQTIDQPISGRFCESAQFI